MHAVFRFEGLVRGVVRWWVAGMLALVVGRGWAAEDGARLSLLSRLVEDPSPRVRVEALRALAKVPTAQAAELALSVLERPMDPTLDYALWLTINDLAEPWIEAVRSGAWKLEGREKQLEFALRALKAEHVARVLGSVLGARPLSRDGRGPWIEILGAAGTAADLRRLFDQSLLAEGFDRPSTARALKALGEAMRLRKARPAGDLSGVATLFGSADAAIQEEAMRLAGLWKEVGGAVGELMDRLERLPESAETTRATGLEAMRQIGGESVVGRLEQWASGTGTANLALRRSAAVTWAALDSTKGIPATVRVGESLRDEKEALVHWRGVLAIKGAGPVLARALEGRRLFEPVARAGMRVAREGGRDDVELVGAFAAAGGFAAETEKLTGDLLKDMAARVVSKGDPYRGELVYRRADLACTVCHAIGGAGGKVGPDMTSIGASAPVDYLVESLVLPNAKIKEGYHSLVVSTRDGEEYTGTVARETQEEIVLRNATGLEMSIAKSAIQQREIGKLSLMPSGLLEALSEQERLDLIAFLSRLGKPGDFDASRGGVARTWRVGNLVHTDIQNNAADWIWKEPWTERRWISVTALVKGEVSLDLLEAASKAQAWTSKVAVVAATEIELAAAGPVRFRMGVPEAELWIDGRLLGSGRDIREDVPAGRHRMVVKMDPRRLPEGLRLEAEGASFVLD